MANFKDKIEHLNDYLIDKYHINLAKCIDIDEEEYLNYLNLKEKDKKITKKICEIFYLNENILLDDSIELPHDEFLSVDEPIVKSHLGNYINDIEKNKNKNVIKKNYKILDNKLKRRMFIELTVIIIPFLFIVLYSLILSSTNIVSTLNNYKEGDELSSSQKEIEEKLLKYDEENETHYANVKVGATLESIQNISSSNSTFNSTMSLTFDFDQKEYYNMYYYKSKDETFNKDNFYTSEDLLADNFCFDSTKTGYLEYKDNIPDIYQFNFLPSTHMSSLNKPISVSTLYLEEENAFPGEKSSNIYPSKNDEFRIGNGKISPDTLEYQDKGTAYFDEKSQSYRYTQKLHFETTINKIFDSPRYPLDSAQFKTYIQPTKSSNYIRYIPDTTISGYSTYFSLSDGYRLIKETNGIKNFNIKINYYIDNGFDDATSSYTQTIKTQIEIITRANKHGISIYLNSFLNIIAIAIWLTLAFYNQSFNKDDSMSMIGTGFFSAISAILLGLSTVGNANTFSLLTFINIFTLMMVLIIGFESIKAKRYTKLNNTKLIAYSNVTMRILFYFLLTCSIIIYILIPAISYIWFL